MDDIARQARQGSVSAIIQMLNEKLADSGVRTRAMLDHGVLQLLCEAATPEQLEQATLVERVQRILESLSPRNIRRININSRIAKEQQLLWLQEIQRDPEGQILWSQEITLKQMNPLKRLVDDWRYERYIDALKPVSKSNREEKESRRFWRGVLVGGASLALLTVLVGWALADWLGIQLPNAQIQVTTKPKPGNSPANNVASNAIATQPDPFVQAVRLAEQASRDGQIAKTPADWLDLASRWQRASDLMSQVQPDDTRYQTAQSRIQLYHDNSQAALQKAETLRPSPAQ